MKSNLPANLLPSTPPQDKKQELARYEAGVQRLMTSTALSASEIQVVRNELNSQTLRSLTDDDLHDHLVDLWKEVKILTGAILYNGKDLAIQIEVLRMFLISSREFSNLTLSEIRHAFYLNAQGEYDQIFPHYNREINAEYVGNVLSAYLKYKRCIYRLAGADIRALLAPPKQKALKIRISDQRYAEFIQDDYELFRAGKAEWIFNTTAKYAVLRRAGLIPVYSRAHWFKLYGYAMIARRRENRKDGTIRRIYERFDREGWVPMDEHRRIVEQLRRDSYLWFFEIIRGTAIVNIFQDIKNNLNP